MKFPRLLVSLVFLLTLTGCASWFIPMKSGHSSTVVSYLYPNATAAPELSPGPTILSPPVRVGVAFVPGNMNRGEVAETERMKLLERVRAAFAKHPQIGGIEIIPTAYLRQGGGFSNLQQAAQMFNVEVVALVSYDQIQFNDSNALSVLYWTIVGAYVIQGDRYDVQTLLDISVFDVKSRRLLMRAPGQSQVKGSATRMALSEDSRNARVEGFEKAVDQAIPALAKELELFQERVKIDPQFKVAAMPGRRGGGSVDWLLLAIIALLGVAWLAVRRCEDGAHNEDELITLYEYSQDR